MEMNSKKTKTMVFSKTGNIQCNITVNGETLERVTKYKYHGSWLTEDGRCDLEIKTRIGMAKDAFWKHKDLLNSTQLKFISGIIWPIEKTYITLREEKNKGTSV